MSTDDFGLDGATLATVAVTTVAGALTGAIVGNRATRSLARNHPLSPGHRTAIVIGVPLAGATAGAIAAIPLISSSAGSGTPFGSDEGTFAILTAAGAALGIVYVQSRWDTIGARVRVIPEVRQARYALTVRVSI